jgi:hypothetical protein
MKKRYQTIIGVLLIGSLALSGCTQSSNKDTPSAATSSSNTSFNSALETQNISAAKEEFIDSNKLAANIKSKYENDDSATYLEPVYGVERNHGFTMTLGFNPLELGFETFDQLFGVYADSDFTKKIVQGFDIEENEDNTYTVICKPGVLSAASIDAVMLNEDIRLGNGYHLYDKGEYQDWGNLPQYYFVQWVDLMTGEKLEKPLAYIFTIKTELEAPNAEFYITNQGSPAFTWDKITGAKEYYILKIDTTGERVGSAQVIARTTDTAWEYSTETSADFMNQDFHNYHNNVNTVEGDSVYEYSYAVIAVNDEGSSSTSTLYPEREITYRLPYKIHQETLVDEETGQRINLTQTEEIGRLPAQVPLMMCDESIVMRTITYHTKEAKVVQESSFLVEEVENNELKNIQKETYNVLKIPYSIDGTNFANEIKIRNFDEAAYPEELKAIDERQNELKGRSGAASSFLISDTENKDTSDGSDHVTSTDDKIFATSALSEYLAANMLVRTEQIPLQDFPESSDKRILEDALSEARYQNPMILGIQTTKLSSDHKALLISYEDDKNSFFKKQAEIRQAVEDIIAKIIKPDMTALEKEFAINNYLCDTGKYDYNALDNSRKYNFSKVDEKYYNAFTPYGILIEKSGVCASYAGAFKLLADACGLDSIIVTGYLEGNLPHAWNRVKIDEEWVSVDPTNNDNPLLFNALLNLPDNAANMLLVEDDRYLNNKYIQNYKADTGNTEYYRVIDKYFSREDIVNRLTEQLKINKAVTLRTEYNLDDNAFQNITDEVSEKLQVENIYGFHWMGVITLSLERNALTAPPAS